MGRMNKPLTVLDLVPVDGGTSVVLPPEVAARLDAGGSGRVALVQNEDGSVHLESAQSEFDRQMAAGREIMKRRRHALSVLAK